MKHFAVIMLAALFTGCAGPRERLTFPYRPLIASPQPQWFDVDHNGKRDFAFTFDAAGRVDAVQYDDDEDGRVDRAYHLRDYDNDHVPHLILLLDSVPFQCVQERYAAGEFRWFDPPRKVIAPFPSLTEVCYSELLDAPPLPGMVDQYYDRRLNRQRSGLWHRLTGYVEPWERYIHYRAKFSESGMCYMHPDVWYPAELARTRRVLDESPDRTTIVYLTSASGMACRHGWDGVEGVLDGMARLCMQLLYERQGAIKISVMADHGHNMALSKNIHLSAPLAAAGFHPTDRIDHPNDVVLEITGLVTYAAVRTRQPAKVADVLLKQDGVQLTFYMDGERVLIRDASGVAAIDYRDGKLRYRALTRDVLGYQSMLDSLRRRKQLDAGGFASRDDWFAATIDHEYPDAPARVWDAFHGKVINPPEVMFTTLDGFCAGLSFFERYITMASSHGSLNQSNSATFLMTMTGRASGPLRTRDVMRTIEPTYSPMVRVKP